MYRRIPPVSKIQEEMAVFTGITGNTGSRARPGSQVFEWVTLLQLFLGSQVFFIRMKN